jgi:hypothetical protein
MNGGDFEIAPSAASYTYWVEGVLVIKTTTDIVTIAADQDLTFVYFDPAGVLQQSTTPWDLLASTVPVATVFRDGAIYKITEERHDYSSNRVQHRLDHFSIGTRYGSGLAGAFLDAAFSIEQGVVFDEELLHNIIAQASGNIWYRNAGLTSMRVENAVATPYRVVNAGVDDTLMFDDAGTLTAAANNRYINYYIYGAGVLGSPIQTLVGQAQYTTVSGAENESFPAILMGVAEWKLLYRVTYRNVGGTPDFISAVDYRNVSTGPAVDAGSIVHAGTTGRSAPDSHPASAISTVVAAFTKNLSASDTDVQKALDTIDDLDLGGGSLSVNQVAHGFTAPTTAVTVVRPTNAGWVRAKADSSLNAEACWVVIAVAGVDNFTVQKIGDVVITGWQNGGALTVNTTYFLSPTSAGVPTTTKPTTVGQIVLPVLRTSTTDKGEILDLIGLKLSAQPQTVIKNLLWVAKNGSDLTGLGHMTSPFLTLKHALSTITDADVTNRYIIKVGPGVFIEDNPLVNIPYVDIVSCNGASSTVIEADTSSSDLFAGADNSELEGFTLRGTTTAALAKMSVSNGTWVLRDIRVEDGLVGIECAAAGALVLCYDCAAAPITSLGTYFRSSVAGGTVLSYTSMIIRNAPVDTVLHASAPGAVVAAVGFASTSNQVINSAYADSGVIAVIGGRLSGGDYGFRTGGSGGQISAQGIQIESTIFDILVETASGVIEAQTVSFSRDRVSIAAGATVNIGGFDTDVNVYRFLEDMAVGSHGQTGGNFLRAGQGGPYFFGTKVKTFDGSATYADVADGNDISFPNVNADAAIYFGDLSPFIFHAIGYIMGITPINLGAGSIVWEYYDGGSASWLAINSLNTRSGFSNSTADVSFGGASDKGYTIRWDQRIHDGVTEASPSAAGWATVAVDGDTGYWMRCRIVTAITTSPILRSPRMKGSYFEIRPNGTVSHHGDARTARPQLSESGVFKGGAGDQSIDISANIPAFGLKENKFEDTKDDDMYFRILITADMDTSSGIQVVFELSADAPIAGGDKVAVMNLYAAKTGPGATFNGSALEEPTQVNLITFTNLWPAGRSQRYVLAKRIDISDRKTGDIIWCRLQRPANHGSDDLVADVVLENFFYGIREWQVGTLNE